MPRRQPKPLRARLDLRLPVELLEELQGVADRLGIDLAVVARTALRNGFPLAEKQLRAEIKKYGEVTIRGQVEDA